ncbi:hypothetical protein DITRI_Ditri14bG0122000 [Diplodiscus trichospermus]
MKSSAVCHLYLLRTAAVLQYQLSYNTRKTKRIRSTAETLQTTNLDGETNVKEQIWRYLVGSDVGTIEKKKFGDT